MLAGNTPAGVGYGMGGWDREVEWVGRLELGVVVGVGAILLCWKYPTNFLQLKTFPG